MPKFDIFLCAAFKDYQKLPYVLQSITECLHGYQNIYLCTPCKYAGPELRFPVHYRTDLETLPARPRTWRHRSSWVYQQFIKLFQNQTENDYYFVLDCDTIINKPLQLFDNNKPIWRYFEAPQHNPPYYEFNHAMFNDSFDCSHTWLSDMGLYSKTLINSMLEHYGYSVDTFLAKSYQVIHKTRYPSEADIFMGYMNKYHPNHYIIKQIKNKCDAIEGKNPFANLWSKEMIEDHIKKMKATDYETFAIHSWIDNSHNRWGK